MSVQHLPTPHTRDKTRSRVPTQRTMARTGATTTAAAALLLLALVATSAAAVDAAAGGYEMNAAAAAGGRRSVRAQPAGLTQCMGGCGTKVASCLLDCYNTSTGGTMPICYLGCTNNAVFCATDCTTQGL
ncbi:anther-specific protein RTS-like [Triticum dicoccoides]|nr:anther-specific protein RTS-like [Triticum dicoccoides]XP_044345315.1 anther-specific protein RTS-like [Triticum aestivum]